ncbi:MAG: hypothetical protein CVV02_07950 [Firmicutes bacterium HGW-Firmicutes-7]|nr:MAG: hypothetical protein CVV02_07950 [Firmicutes bacterium HGW-Firmicutes-7]
MNLKPRITLGFFIITIGVVFMLDVLDIIDAVQVSYNYWPLILIILGVFTLVDKNSSTFLGGIFILVGIYFQLNLLDLEIFNRIKLDDFILPVIIIIIGVRVLVKPK